MLPDFGLKSNSLKSDKSFQAAAQRGRDKDGADTGSAHDYGGEGEHLFEDVHRG